MIMHALNVWVLPVGGILVPSGIGISPVMVPVISISTTVTLPDSTVFA